MDDNDDSSSTTSSDKVSSFYNKPVEDNTSSFYSKPTDTVEEVPTTSKEHISTTTSATEEETVPSVSEKPSTGNDNDGDSDNLDLPAIKRRPKRIIKPIQDKKTELVKFVDSDASSDDESDKEWVHDNQNKGNVQADGSAESDDSDSEDSDSSATGDEASSGADNDNEQGLSGLVPPNNEEEKEDEDEERERVTITKEDMPFLFEARAPGKRQIKVIQYKNEIAEKAAEMSSESSSEDEDWRAKQDDIKEQIQQDEDEEVVDMSNVPVTTKDEKTPAQPTNTVRSTHNHEKPKLSHDDALDLSICCVCLTGSEEDNVLECDNCGVTVHEGCYGHPPSDPENDDIDIIWFCEPCVADVDPCCELCPNKTGVMKATDSGKWAHMVCALYTDGIGFGDTTLLEPIITTDISPHRWGYRKCDLCEDTRFAFTGLVAECDAGMCRSRFHVSCAQKLGYCMENTSDDLKADPFFSYCKVHVDKDIARTNKKIFRSLQEHYLAFKSQGVQDSILHGLELKRQEYSEKRKSTLVPAIMTEKHPRALFGSTSAFAKLTRKAEMFGLDTHVTVIEDSELADKPMKSIKPEMTVEFAQQYQTREKHIKQSVARYKHHNSQLMDMREEEHQLQAHIDDLQKDLPKITKKYEKIRKQAVAIWKFLSKVDSSKYQVPECLLEKQKISIKTDVIKRKMGLQYCHICKHGENPETMVDCDECNNWFHFSCLDPPVTKNPKVNKSWAWFCSPCTVRQGEEKEKRKVVPDVKNVKTPQSTTKFGRSVKKPDHYKVEEKPDAKPKPVESPKKLAPEGVLSYESPGSLKSLKTSHCSKCLTSDFTQKLSCAKCSGSYHLHCTNGNHDSGTFICDQCEVPSFSTKKPKLCTSDIVPKTEVRANLKPELMLPKVNLSEALKNTQRKNIFELQYNLLQKRKREATNSQSDKDDIEEALNKSSDIEEPCNTDTDDEIDANDISFEEQPVATSDITSNRSLISNIFKDIQIAVAKVPDDSMVKLGMSPIKNKPKILKQEDIPSIPVEANTCQVSVEIKGESQQITIQQNSLSFCPAGIGSEVVTPTIISSAEKNKNGDSKTEVSNAASGVEISISSADIMSGKCDQIKVQVPKAQNAIIETKTEVSNNSSGLEISISSADNSDKNVDQSNIPNILKLGSSRNVQSGIYSPTIISTEPSADKNENVEATTEVSSTHSGVEISISSTDKIPKNNKQNVVLEQTSHSTDDSTNKTIRIEPESIKLPPKATLISSPRKHKSVTKTADLSSKTRHSVNQRTQSSRPSKSNEYYFQDIVPLTKAKDAKSLPNASTNSPNTDLVPQIVKEKIPSPPKPAPIITKFDPSKFPRKLTADFYESMFEEKSDRYGSDNDRYDND